MVSGPISPQGRFWGPKARSSPKFIHFHENGWISRKRIHFHDNPPFWGEMAPNGRFYLLGYLLKLKNIARIGVFRPRAAKVRFCAQTSHFCENAHFLLQSHFLAKSGFGVQTVIFGHLGGNSTDLEWEFIGFRGFCGFRISHDAKMRKFM